VVDLQVIVQFPWRTDNVNGQKITFFQAKYFYFLGYPLFILLLSGKNRFAMQTFDKQLKKNFKK